VGCCTRIFQRTGGWDDWDSGSDSEEEEEEEVKTPSCRRWSEIKQFLSETREPGDLAWDSMTFEIPEWTLFRYIQARGGLVIAPGEWHDFLVADYRKELFQCVFHPSYSIVKYLANHPQIQIQPLERSLKAHRSWLAHNALPLPSPKRLRTQTKRYLYVRKIDAYGTFFV
jgi:hypothetical protein